MSFELNMEEINSSPIKRKQDYFWKEEKKESKKPI